MGRYIFNDIILFDSIRHEVSLLTNSEDKIILNEPTSNCLMLLILGRLKNLDNPRKIIEHAEFYYFAWRDPKKVTSNNLYQNIFLIRRALTCLLGEGGKGYIVTVSRIGFYLCPDVDVVQCKYIKDITYLKYATGRRLKNRIKKFFRLIKSYGRLSGIV